MRIFFEFAQDRKDLISDIKSTQSVRDEHLFKLLIYLPYRQQEYNTWCKHLWKAYHRLPVTKGVKQNKLIKLIYDSMTCKWIDDFNLFINAQKEELEVDGYPKNVKINSQKLFECFKYFHLQYATMLVENKLITLDELKELINKTQALYTN